MLIFLGIIIYILAAFIASCNMLRVHTSDFVHFIICVFSVPFLPAALTCDWNRKITFWSMSCSALLYIIAIILFFI